MKDAVSKRLYFKIRPFFKWFDFWIGVYVDRTNRTIYFCPLPMFGFKLWWWYETSSEADFKRGGREAVGYIRECIKAGWQPDEAVKSAEKIFQD